jgi:glycosyltransferase involved in cell wall biosynthesis
VPSGTPRPKEQLVVFGGSISHRKGVDVLTAAWQALRDQRPDDGWTLVLAGPTVDPEVVPTGLDDAEFVGPLGHDALMALLERSSVAVLPSRNEAMPMFLLEAMARGNCIVSTRVGGIPSVLDSGSGVLVNPGDAAMLQAALEKVTTDAAFRNDVARRAEDVFAARYSAAAVFPQLERVWKSALELRSHRSGTIRPLLRRSGY